MKSYRFSFFIATVFFLGGYIYGLRSVEPIIQEKIVEVEKKQINTKTKTVIKEKPNGTKTTVITEKSSEKIDTESKSDPVIFEYRVGVFSMANLNDLNKRDYGVSASRRLVGPVWVDLSYGTANYATIGLSIEF